MANECVFCRNSKMVFEQVRCAIYERQGLVLGLACGTGSILKTLSLPPGGYAGRDLVETMSTMGDQIDLVVRPAEDSVVDLSGPRMIVPLQEDHFERVAQIHCDAFGQDLQVIFGPGFLKQLYRGIVRSTYGFGLVFLEGKEPAGFTLATYDVNKLFAEILRRRFFQLTFWGVIQLLRNPKLVKPLFIGVLCLREKQKVGLRAELITVAVNRCYRGKGIGGQLVKAVIERFATRGLMQFRVLTDGDSPGANQFYQKLDFTLAHSFKKFGVSTNIYKYTIKSYIRSGLQPFNV